MTQLRAGRGAGCDQSCLLQRSLPLWPQNQPGSLLNPRSLIPNPGGLILNLDHVPSLILRHPAVVLVKPTNALKLCCHSGHPFPRCHVTRWAHFHKPGPGHTVPYLSQNQGDRPQAQRSPEEGSFCSGLRCGLAHRLGTTHLGPGSWDTFLRTPPSLTGLVSTSFLPSLMKRGSERVAWGLLSYTKQSPPGTARPWLGAVGAFHLHSSPRSEALIPIL